MKYPFARAALAIVALALSAYAHADRIPLYVTYDPVFTDYFYTTNASERDSALAGGYTDQGIAFYVEDSNTSGAAPFQRFYKGDPQNEHFYTINTAEASSVVQAGYVPETGQGYVFANQVTGSSPIYRFSNFNGANGDLVHFYTTNSSYVSSLPAQGWSYEGVIGYGFTRAGVADDYKATILAYHAGEVEGTDCYSYSGVAMIALQQDLETMYNNGFTIVPLRWMTDWAIGFRDSSTMPSKPVALTFDDGYDLDYKDNSHPTCPNLLSARTILANAETAHPTLFAARPLATSFVIASPRARSPDTLWYLHDDWWAAAESEGLLDIQNHSADHDSTSITTELFDNDPAFGGIPLAIGGVVDGQWNGKGDFCRIGMDGVTSAYREIVLAGNYIASKTGMQPIFFANPNGGLSSGLKTYWLNYPTQHGIYAAFATLGKYVQRGASSRYDIPRMLKGTSSAIPGDWYSSTTAMLNVLNGGGREVPTAPSSSVSCP
jgi:hypothetical protein